MSLRTVLRYAMPTILIVLAIGPAIAQPPNPWRIYTAPMPRLKSAGMLHFEFGIEIGSGPVLHGRGIGFELTPTAMPCSRKVPPMIIQAEEEHIQGESSGQLRITPRPVAPLSRGPVPLAMTQGFGNTRQSGNNPFSVQFSCAPPAAQCLPECEEMTYTWGYHGSIPQRLVVVPRMTNRLDCGLLTPCPVESKGPGITVAACLPYELIEWPYPLPLARTVCRDGPGGWWLDATPVPQPRHAMPVVVVQRVRERGPAPVADVRSFGFRVGGEYPGPVRSYAPSAVGATSRSCCQSEPAGCCEKEGKLSGTWYREIEGAVFSATFCGDELKLCMTQRDEGNTFCFVLTADYAITKEGLVHGVVTGVDIDVKRDQRAAAGGLCVMPPAAIAAELQKFVDSPFSFRTKTTSAGVRVSNLKFAAEGMDKPDVALVCGMFKPAPNGKLPAPRDLRSSAVGASRCEPHSYPPVVASPYQPVPTTGMTPPVSMPVVPAGDMIPQPVPQSFAPPKPGNVPPGEFGLMADVFGQMLVTKPQPMLIPSPPAVRAESPASVPIMPIPTPPRFEKPR